MKQIANNPAPERGFCVFGTGEGLTIEGKGCLSEPSDDLLHALDLRSHKIERDEQFWFSIPGQVGGLPGRVIGRVAYARDYKHRDGIAGAAFVITEQTVDKQGFVYSVRAIKKLHEEFLTNCIDRSSLILTFSQASSVLNSFVIPRTIDSFLVINQREPLRVRLPRDWEQYISLEQLLGLIKQHDDFKALATRGYVLRESASAQCDVEIDTAFLGTWNEAILGDRNTLVAKAKATDERYSKLRAEYDLALRSKEELEREQQRVLKLLKAEQAHAEEISTNLESVRAKAQERDQLVKRLAGQLEQSDHEKEKLLAEIKQDQRRRENIVKVKIELREAQEHKRKLNNVVETLQLKISSLVREREKLEVVHEEEIKRLVTELRASRSNNESLQPRMDLISIITRVIVFALFVGAAVFLSRLPIFEAGDPDPIQHSVGARASQLNRIRNDLRSKVDELDKLKARLNEAKAKIQTLEDAKQKVTSDLDKEVELNRMLESQIQKLPSPEQESLKQSQSTQKLSTVVPSPEDPPVGGQIEASDTLCGLTSKDHEFLLRIQDDCLRGYSQYVICKDVSYFNNIFDRLQSCEKAKACDKGDNSSKKWKKPLNYINAEQTLAAQGILSVMECLKLP
jgi:hypothetical protein